MGKYGNKNCAPYWTCKCGAWTWSTSTSCFGCGRWPSAEAAKWIGVDAKKSQRSRAPPTARSASGARPTQQVSIGDWVVQPRGRREQAKARAAATSAASASPSPVRVDTRARTPPRRSAAPTPSDQPVPDSPVADPQPAKPKGKDEHGAESHDAPAWPPESADEDTISRWLQCMRGLPKDEVLEGRRKLLEERLADIRRNKRNPTVQLLRAQAVTRKRERQQETAAGKVAALEEKLEDLRAQLGEAKLAVITAGVNLEEARENERALRAGVAPIAESQGGHELPAGTMQDLEGLRAQLEALPAAYRAGNLHVAHAAILRQAECIIAKAARASGATAGIATPTYEDEYHNDAMSDGGAHPETPRREDATDRRCRSRDADPGRTPDGTSAVHHVLSPFPLVSGRRGTSPPSDRRGRSRSRCSGAGERSESEATALRRVARMPGQKRLEWAAKAPARP